MKYLNLITATTISLICTSLLQANPLNQGCKNIEINKESGKYSISYQCASGDYMSVTLLGLTPKISNEPSCSDTAIYKMDTIGLYTYVRPDGLYSQSYVYNMDNNRVEAQIRSPRCEVASIRDLSKEEIGKIRSPVNILAQASSLYNIIVGNYTTEAKSITVNNYTEIRDLNYCNGNLRVGSC